MFRCDNLVLDDAVDVQGCCRKAEELFELYQRCANRKQIETICVNFLRGMEATKLSVTGHMYFVPRILWSAWIFSRTSSPCSAD